MRTVATTQKPPARLRAEGYLLRSPRGSRGYPTHPHIIRRVRLPRPPPRPLSHRERGDRVLHALLPVGETAAPQGASPASGAARGGHPASAPALGVRNAEKDRYAQPSLERGTSGGPELKRGVMHLERLRLTDFRNYAALDLALRPGLIVFQGRNAQGKSNVLEAVALLATTRSFRTSTERETVRWGAAGHFARVDGTVARRRDTLHVEIVIADATLVGAGDPGAVAAPAPGLPLPLRKRIRVNGPPRRAMDR